MGTALLVDTHVRYIVALASHKSSLTYHLTTHLRLNAIYWALAALHLLRSPNSLPKDDIIRYVMECWDDVHGGFGSHPDHDCHIHATLSGLQILLMYGELRTYFGDHENHDRREKLISYILSLQDKTSGAFAGDSTQIEYDSRFLYCAVCSLALLSTTEEKHHTPAEANGREQPLRDPLTRVDWKVTVNAVLACQNFDGGFGRGQGAESHGSQAFVCIGTLRILQAVHMFSQDKRLRLESWLSERQLPNGGLNGRPQKLEDVCYSWWILSALSMLGKLRWINGEKLSNFILSCQDPDHGGIADRPDNVADVFHTLFGVAGLSVLQASPAASQLDEVDPVYCLPVACIEQNPVLRRPYQSLKHNTNVH